MIHTLVLNIIVSHHISCGIIKRRTYIAKQTEACSGGANNGIEQGITVKATISNNLAWPDYWAFLAARHVAWVEMR